MARLHIVVLLPLLAAAGACWHGNSPTAPGDTVPFSTVYEAQSTGVTDGRVQTIASAAEWANVWQEIQRPSSPPAPLPPVDFASQRLLLAAAGTRPDGCYAIAVEEIERRGRTLVARIVETVPGSGCVCTQALTQPVHVVQLERTGEPISGITERRAARCS